MPDGTDRTVTSVAHGGMPYYGEVKGTDSLGAGLVGLLTGLSHGPGICTHIPSRASMRHTRGRSRMR